MLKFAIVRIVSLSLCTHKYPKCSVHIQTQSYAEPFILAAWDWIAVWTQAGTGDTTDTCTTPRQAATHTCR